ncbi:E3 ubiquitin-protein ligase RNF10 [Brevipalpus obovatus]|uniref:E3 ubiquitin-protein ligase RNF10 n=1 Tax=Brevipalpus obovatus TaxID=246614 RepID=UPI003D9F4F83
MEKSCTNSIRVLTPSRNRCGSATGNPHVSNSNGNDSRKSQNNGKGNFNHKNRPRNNGYRRDGRSDSSYNNNNNHREPSTSSQAPSTSDAYRKSGSLGQFPSSSPKSSNYKGKKSTALLRNEDIENLSIQMNLEDDDESLVHSKSHGSKKRNLNHLLNFRMPSREFTTGNNKGYSKRTGPKYHQHFSKEQFLQANYQFIVRQGSDVAKYQLDPDVPVEWSTVEEIRFNSLVRETSSCPICLQSPVAAKITKCGHIYCWPCILHYLALSDNKWRKCPICYSNICQDDLTSVSSISRLDYNVGDEITLTLMKRKKGTIVPLPANQPDVATFYGFDEGAEDTLYQKLLIASADQVLIHIVGRERKQLMKLWEEEKESSESCFIENALNQLKERETKLRLSVELDKIERAQRNQLSRKIESVQQEIPTIVEALPRKSVKPRISWFDGSILEESSEQELSMVQTAPESSSSDKVQSLKDKPSDVVIEELEKPVDCPSTELAKVIKKEDEKTAKDNHFYFYQSSDGQQIYLHSLNVKMLSHEYGSLASCPQTISGKIVEMTGSSMDLEHRNRLRYIQHLPLTCEFKVVEVRFESPQIKESTKEVFKNEINSRERARNRKARDERKRERNINIGKKKMQGMHSAPHYQLDNLNQFPSGFREVSADTRPDSPKVSNASSANDEDANLINAKHGSLSVSPSTSPPRAGTFSFASMLKSGCAKTPPVKSTIDDPVVSDVIDSNGCSKGLRDFSLGDALEAALVVSKNSKKKRNSRSDSSKE